MRRNLICGIYVKLEYVLKTIINRIWIIFITIHEYKNIWKLRKIYKKVTLSKEQKKQIDNFYLQNYGKKISYKWHRLYQSYTGKFDYKYVPEYIFTTKLEPKANKRIEVMPYENKNMLSIFFNEKNNPNIKTPETYIMCVEGRYFDKDRNLIDKNEAIKILKNGIYDAVIKVTVDTSSGKDVHVLSLQNGIDRKTNKKIEDIITSMGKNFVVQEKIIPDKSYELLYDKSINTLRIITYMTKNGIKTAPIILRIGQGGSTVDNTNAGGIFIGVNKDGKLLEEAFTKSQKRYKVHPDTGIVFSEYQLPCVNKAKECAIEMHKKFPMLNYISWDLAIDKDGKVVIIEANMHSQGIWLVQMAHGTSLFEENTAEILQTLRRDSKTRGEK